MNYGPRDTRDEAVAYLTKVGDALGEGGITLTDALSELEDTLASSGFSAASDQQLQEARDSYTRQFGHRDQSRAIAQNAGAPPQQQQGNPGPAPVSRDGNGAEQQPPQAEPLPIRPAVHQPAVGTSPLTDSGLEATDLREFLEWRRLRDNSGESSTPKKRAYPWSDKLSVEDDPSLHPNVAKTRRLTIIYTKDLDTAKSTLYDVSNLPEVPDTVWKSVLKNEFVDLDKIHSAYTSVVDTKKRAEKLAEGVYIQTESDAPTKSINRDSDWLQAFRVYARAVALVFPHRVDELNAWEAVVGRKFRVFNPNVHKTEPSSKRTFLRSSYRLGSRPTVRNIRPLRVARRPLVKVLAALIRILANDPKLRKGVARLSAIPGIAVLANAPTHVASGTSASYAPENIPSSAAQKRQSEPGAASREANLRFAKQSFRRGLIWRDGDPTNSPSAESTIYAPPFPSPPESEQRNSAALGTISDKPDLFQVISPWNVDEFERLLATHPNRPLVESACRGLREGFWPFADTSSHMSPKPEVVPNHKMDEKGLAFAASQRDEEVSVRRFSPAFSQLLPGMQTSAIGVVPKPHSEKYRLITDQSAGAHPLNSFISKEDAKVRYDTLQDLGRALRDLKTKSPSTPFVLWKSDVAHAFRTIPMHPLWQIRQVVLVGDSYHVDRCMAFGNRSSPVIWCRLAGLVAWIAINVIGLRFCHHYMDDFWSIERGLIMVPYKPYGCELPHSQVQLLMLWDKLGIPHERDKQLFGTRLSVIGFEVDTEAMTFRMGKAEREALASSIMEFLATKKRSHPLREWQRLLGWCNWALNVLPYCRPALTSPEDKISMKERPHAPIYINKPVRENLEWFANRLHTNKGLSLIRANSWEDNSADLVVICDACPSGMGFWSPTRNQAFYYRIPPETERSSNFCEAACLLSALGWAVSIQELPLFPRILIFSDNLDACNVFSTMAGHAPYHSMTLQAAAWLLDHNILLRVKHIIGKENLIADYLSRGMLEHVRRINRRLPIAEFNPLPNVFPGKTGIQKPDTL
ncbi:hypothetical protein RSAG8_12964, partial [Rhizoctonia solani AG-8 WAC10335]